MVTSAARWLLRALGRFLRQAAAQAWTITRDAARDAVVESWKMIVTLVVTTLFAAIATDIALRVRTGEGLVERINAELLP